MHLCARACLPPVTGSPPKSMSLFSGAVYTPSGTIIVSPSDAANSALWMFYFALHVPRSHVSQRAFDASLPVAPLT